MKLVILFLIFALVFIGQASAWQSDTNIVSGLTDVGFYSAPTTFTNNSILYLISGKLDGVFIGFNWTGSTWQSDTSIVSGLTNVVDRSTPTVFTNNSKLYLISGNGTTGLFTGFNHTGTTWQADTNIVSGLTDVGACSAPTVFTNNSILYLISGDSLGLWTGFNWTGSTWQSDNSIVSGLTDIGAFSNPTVFTNNSILYLISGEGTGVFFGFNWTGITWQVDNAIVSGLTDIGGNSAPTTFTNNSKLYLISGEYDGTFNGWNTTYSEGGEPSNPPTPINLAQTNGSFWVNYTWEAGTDNITNSYNVSQNETWTNGSSNTFKNDSVGAHGWSNISVYAYNSSGTGTLNQTPISANTQVPNNAPVQSTIGNKQVIVGQWLNFTVNATDADNDTITYGTNTSNGTLNSSTGNFNWSTTSGDVGTYYWNFNSSDAYSGVDDETIVTIVNHSAPSISFVSPTLSNGSSVDNSSVLIPINTSSSGTANNRSAYMDFDNDIQGLYILNETSGTSTIDYSGYGRTGTWAGSALTSVTSSYGYPSIHFDGTNNITIPTITKLTGFYDQTISGSIYINDNSIEQVIFSNVVSAGNFFGIRIVSGDIVFGFSRSYSPAGRKSSITNVPENTWIDFVYQYNATSLEGNLTLNGVEQTYTNVSGAIDNTIVGARIGSNNNNSKFFTGNLSKLLIQNRIVSDAEINASFNNSQYVLNTTVKESPGTYTYYGIVLDSNSFNTTETRTVIVPNTVPIISFVSPTAENNSIITDRKLYINTTASDADSDYISASLNYNSTRKNCYSFDNNSGNVIVDRCGENNGTFNGVNTSSLVTGKIYNAINFSGQNISVTPLNYVTKNSDYSFTGWIYSSSYSTASVIFSNVLSSSDALIVSENWNRIQVGHWSGSAYDYVSSATGAVGGLSWNHIAYTHNATSEVGTLYLNGVEQEGTINPVGTVTTVGASFGCSVVNTACINSTLDDWEFYSRVITQEEVSASYNADSYPLNVTISNLSNGVTTIQAFIKDSGGDINQTDNRTLTFTATLYPPNIPINYGCLQTGYYLNCTWEPNATGNISDSYSLTRSDATVSGITNLYYNVSVGTKHSLWSNLTAYNNSWASSSIISNASAEPSIINFAYTTNNLTWANITWEENE